MVPEGRSLQRNRRLKVVINLVVSVNARIVAGGNDWALALALRQRRPVLLQRVEGVLCPLDHFEIGVLTGLHAQSALLSV